MSHETLIVAVTGIAVSGVVGPWATAWAQRRASAQAFARDRKQTRLDELVSLIDEAAQLLAVGATNGRLYAEAMESGVEPEAGLQEWAQKVNTHKQRLRLGYGLRLGGRVLQDSRWSAAAGTPSRYRLVIRTPRSKSFGGHSPWSGHNPGFSLLQTNRARNQSLHTSRGASVHRTKPQAG